MDNLRSNIPRILVFLMNAYSTHGSILRGVLDYTRSHTPWALDLRTGRRDEANLMDADWSTCDGAIVNGTTPEILQQIHRRGIPVVLVNSNDNSDFPGCVLHCDNAPIAETAAQFLLSRESAAYAFVDVPGMLWSNKRGVHFRSLVQNSNNTCLWLRADNIRALAQQITSAPKPLGVFAADDVRARMTLDICRTAGLAVPDDVAILGVDNDETLCEFSSPTLSSIPLSTHQAGYRAAAIIDQVLHGELTPRTMPDVTYTGTHVVERQSTERSFSQDPLVRKCRALIAANLASSLRISALAQSLHVSRRTLETRFHAVTHTTIAAEILRLRLERAQRLLAETDQSQEAIADACGFCDASHLGATFRRCFGKAPSHFRR